MNNQNPYKRVPDAETKQKAQARVPIPPYTPAIPRPLAHLRLEPLHGVLRPEIRGGEGQDEWVRCVRREEACR